jgi:5-(carboxyamino)imidazole ribonucleotide mutase
VSRLKNQRHPRVAILMGSDSDFAVMREAANTLERFGISYEMEVLSAHRSPRRLHDYAGKAAGRGIQVIIAGAGGAAHLAGAVAAASTLPVIAVPIASTTLGGLDALLSSVQMPAGVPVATMAIDQTGARNAGIFAAQILATSDERLRSKLIAYKEELARSIEEKSARVRQQLASQSK